MSSQAPRAASVDLFARKGTAGTSGGSAHTAGPVPLGSVRAGGTKGAGQEDGEEKSGGTSRGASETAAPSSLTIIDFRRAGALAAALAQSPSPAAADAALTARGRAQSPSSLQGPMLALLAVIFFAVGLWYALHGTEPAPVDGVTTAQEAPAAAAERPGAGSGSQSAPPAPDSTAELPSLPPTETQEAGAVARDTEGGDAGVQPSFDLIRIEPNGEAVIAGRAAPNSQLILLDNGQPIGKVTADWAGEWAFIPATPLAPGDHEFSLVIITPQGTVAVPGVGKPNKGSFLRSPDLDGGSVIKAKAVGGVAPEQPATGALARSDQAAGRAPTYVVQLSSTTSLEGAEREWLKLKRSFPRLLGDKELEVHEAALDKRGTWYRVRTGNFTEKASARKLCSQLRAKRQDCLVIAR